MSYAYDEASKVLDAEEPIVTRAMLLTICKEIDAETPEGETDSFIGDAHTLVVMVLDGWGIPLALLTLIEKNLAAHFANLTYPSTQRASMGPFGETLAIKTGFGLEATRYGQTAMSLDPTGRLTDYSNGKGHRSVRITNIGNGITPTE